MPKRPQSDEYSEDEAQRRFLDALKAGLKTAPTPLKDKPKVRKKARKAKKAK